MDRLFDDGVGSALGRDRRPLDEIPQVGGQIERIEPGRTPGEGNRLGHGIDAADPEQGPPHRQKRQPGFFEIHVVEAHPRRKAQLESQIRLDHRSEVDQPPENGGCEPLGSSRRHRTSVTKGCDEVVDRWRVAGRPGQYLDVTTPEPLP